MNKIMKLLHFITYVVIIIMPVTIIMINKINYIGVFRVGLVIHISVYTLVGLIYSRFLKLSKWVQRALLIISLLSCMTISLIFIVNKPTYTINESVSRIIETSQISNVHQNEKYNVMRITPRANLFISSGYVLTGILSEKEVTIIFNPITGEYAIIK